MSPSELESHLTREQKTGFVLLLFFAMITVGLGFLQLHNTIYSPFAVKFLKNNKQAIQLQDEATRLQSIDTDRDGLNDYEEITFYQTSAYLPDTDSDGMGDKAEIEAKTDPLCPAGQTCEQVDLPSSESTENGFLEKAKNLPTPATITGNTMAGPADISALLKDPKQLRAYLIGTGKVTEEQLAKIDDETLLKTFTSVYEKQVAGQATTTSSVSTSSTP